MEGIRNGDPGIFQNEGRLVGEVPRI